MVVRTYVLCVLYVCIQWTIVNLDVSHVSDGFVHPVASFVQNLSF